MRVCPTRCVVNVTRRLVVSLSNRVTFVSTAIGIHSRHHCGHHSLRRDSDTAQPPRSEPTTPDRFERPPLIYALPTPLLVAPPSSLLVSPPTHHHHHYHEARHWRHGHAWPYLWTSSKLSAATTASPHRGRSGIVGRKSYRLCGAFNMARGEGGIRSSRAWAGAEPVVDRRCELCSRLDAVRVRLASTRMVDVVDPTGGGAQHTTTIGTVANAV